MSSGAKPTAGVAAAPPLGTDQGGTEVAETITERSTADDENQADAVGLGDASEQPAVSSVVDVGTASAATASVGSLLEQYRAAFQSIDGMIRDLATSCVAVEAVNAGHWRVLMENEYLAELCQRQDRRQQIEGAVESSLGRRIRIDFGFRPESQPHGATAKPTNKTQALRDLQELPFVVKLNEIYSAEWVELLPARPRKNLDS